ncbi:uncharacterized protein LOC127131353 [Lathyrus oleraceus]|uniref:uncharacterized protein LOC127131353 n=1 Tax=Pisum sativum TaxID=3888 RepID=UPI001FC65190|nr:uncharacterized protein LOC127131353 [Pisum sativum]
MAAFSRNKRVSGFFDEEARARLIASDHCNLNSLSDDNESISLSALVHGFLEEHTNSNDDSVANEFEMDRVDSDNDSSMMKRLNAVQSNNEDHYRITLLEHVSEAIEFFAFLKERNISNFRQSVAAFLRERGHDAEVCVTTWNAYDGAITAGSYEFIDVVQTGFITRRYFVDLEFRAQFEIARPTRQFSEVLSSVPGVFVGGETELRRTVTILCDAAKRCFMTRELSIPPWRKTRFMKNKWFAPSRRTVNPVYGKPVKVTAVNGVSCRLLGFHDVVMETRRGGAVTVRTR